MSSQTSNVTRLTTATTPQTAKEVIAETVRLLIEQLEAGHSEGLTAMGRFHHYSLGNILEIARQKLDATRVAGMYAWNKLDQRDRAPRLLSPEHRRRTHARPFALRGCPALLLHPVS